MKDLTPVRLFTSRYKEPLEVRLRSSALLRILVYPARYTIVGTVRRGMNMGLLAIDPKGDFVRVNGWYVEPLMQKAVLAALQRCTDSKEHLEGVLSKSREHRANIVTPKITVRKTHAH